MILIWVNLHEQWIHIMNAKQSDFDIVVMVLLNLGKNNVIQMIQQNLAGELVDVLPPVLQIRKIEAPYVLDFL